MSGLKKTVNTKHTLELRLVDTLGFQNVRLGRSSLGDSALHVPTKSDLGNTLSILGNGANKNAQFCRTGVGHMGIYRGFNPGHMGIYRGFNPGHMGIYEKNIYVENM